MAKKGALVGTFGKYELRELGRKMDDEKLYIVYNGNKMEYMNVRKQVATEYAKGLALKDESGMEFAVEGITYRAKGSQYFESGKRIKKDKWVVMFREYVMRNEPKVSDAELLEAIKRR